MKGGNAIVKGFVDTDIGYISTSSVYPFVEAMYCQNEQDFYYKKASDITCRLTWNQRRVAWTRCGTSRINLTTILTAFLTKAAQYTAVVST